ncbi:sensor histidine kinase [Microbacterium saperdae]|uniref:histidine kinase n=1 Tax=Microbacterium saperdae TaxID=69368 RepID=A0A543BL79_9MICO|nr:ATP-binding protein [Microbacterium saperdae]TQL85571.1 signal transduction histidine kinase [Microbacterium saperdae]
MLGAVLSRRFPLVGVFLAGIATAVGWSFGVTVDPFLLVSVGVLTFAERRGSRRFPWWLLIAWAGLMVTALILGSHPEAAGFEDRMRGVLLSAIVLAAAWVLGVRTRQARLEAAARARTDERLRLARDVHDALSHSLGAIGVQAGVAAHVTALSEPELRATLQEVESQARSSLLELKLLLYSERSTRSESGTVSLPLTCLLRDTARTAERSGLEVELDSMESVDALPAVVRTTVHRIVQEAVTNAIRHAKASRLRISATVRDATVEVIVSDDGIGVPDGVHEGHGLAGMRERVALVGGELSVESAPTGLTVTARLPVSAADENEVRA